ncbi:sn-glycerol-1-phosphate dehydrogenase [Paenibacillus antri]|uniref:sn-glycerol-1-phosphate dehydrogenase n=1 Tax=Paenibacillus antri TaxID=2582848 RepID=A0A5R9G5B2_9BACL|nr:sn-glycerol-1-phosphate dehydrogenase [Paenibacillus antri]TLS51552.1 sn-glycerol-1-phosphate dehydrogenase [Paenibacillus antri]
MNEIMERIRGMAEETGESIEGVAFPEPIVLAPGAVDAAADWLTASGYARVQVIADANTYEAAGKRLTDGLVARGASAVPTIVLPNALGDVAADEASVVQVLLDAQRTGAEALVVVGAGTLHDIARYAAFTCGRPFVSVPTAPSVDGFTSVGAPLIVRGDKITIPAVGPAAIFADVDLLTAAPRALIAAGFGDMLGKYTSLFDWRFGAATADEPYSPLAAAITERALAKCVAQAGAIGRGEPAAVVALMEALIESGLAMLIFGQSHPASGAEHHVSHYWEMEYIRRQRRQLLHGAKVGVACALVSERYRRIAEEDSVALDGVPDLRSMLQAVPGPTELRALLAEAGGPATPEELGVEPTLVQESLERAHRVRLNRATLLRRYNELSQLNK